jgi:hypothetical protein
MFYHTEQTKVKLKTKRKLSKTHFWLLIILCNDMKNKKALQKFVKLFTIPSWDFHIQLNFLLNISILFYYFAVPSMVIILPFSSYSNSTTFILLSQVISLEGTQS